MIYLAHPEERPAHSIPRIDARDENSWQEAAEEVAREHFNSCSESFVAWVADECGNSIPAETIAALISGLLAEPHVLQIAKGVADCIRNDWVQFVANARQFSHWETERNLYDEIRRRA